MKKPAYDIAQLSLSVSPIRGELYGSVSLTYSEVGDFSVTEIESVPVPFMNLHMASNFVEFVLPVARCEYAGSKSHWPQGQKLFTIDFYPLDFPMAIEPIEDAFSALAIHAMFAYFTYQRCEELPPVFVNFVEGFLYQIEQAYPDAFEGDL